jgi:hypothetical protein
MRPKLSAPGSTGRPSKHRHLESHDRLGVLDAPHARGMTAEVAAVFYFAR